MNFLNFLIISCVLSIAFANQAIVCKLVDSDNKQNESKHFTSPKIYIEENASSATEVGTDKERQINKTEIMELKIMIKSKHYVVANQCKK